MKLSEIAVQGYKSLVDARLPLCPLSVMIGPNGSGKTAALELFLLLRSAARGELARFVEASGGLDAVLSKVPQGPEELGLELTLDVEDQDNPEPMIYRFQLAPRGAGYAIASEHLDWRRDPKESEHDRYIDAQYEDITILDHFGLRDFDLEHNTLELVLAQLPRVARELQPLKNTLSTTQLYSAFDVGPRAAVRLPQLLTPAARPGPNGEQLFSALYNMRELYQDVYQQIEDVLHTGFPGFQRLDLRLVGAGQATMTWQQSDLTAPLYPNQLSEGTLRFLWLAAVLLAPDPPPVTLIDEPEVSLHPELVKLLAGLLQDASARGQVVVATHSPDLVRWLQPDEVVVLDKADGCTRFTRAGSMDLDEWLEEYTLRDLWLMGTLGGRP